MMQLQQLPLIGPLSKHSKHLTKGDHLLHFYESHLALASLLCDFIIPGLAANEGIIIIATHDTRSTLERALQQRGVRAEDYIKTGQLVLLDAAAVLSSLCEKGAPDSELFMKIVGSVVGDLHKKFPHIRAYGEMVSLLWQRPDPVATLKLERLWNRLAEDHHFTLFCGYHQAHTVSPKGSAQLSGVCCSHTHVLTADGNLRLIGVA